MYKYPDIDFEFFDADHKNRELYKQAVKFCKKFTACKGYLSANLASSF